MDKHTFARTFCGRQAGTIFIGHYCITPFVGIIYSSALIAKYSSGEFYVTLFRSSSWAGTSWLLNDGSKFSDKWFTSLPRTHVYGLSVLPVTSHSVYCTSCNRSTIDNLYSWTSATTLCWFIATWHARIEDNMFSQMGCPGCHGHHWLPWHWPMEWLYSVAREWSPVKKLVFISTCVP